MVVVDVLLGLNLLVLGACAARGRSERRTPFASAGIARSHRSGFRAAVDGGDQDAVILPFRPRVHPADIQRAMALHPSSAAVTPGEN